VPAGADVDRVPPMRHLGQMSERKAGKHVAFYFIPPDIHMREELARNETRHEQEQMPTRLRDAGFRHEAEDGNRAREGRRTVRTLLLVGSTLVVVALLLVFYLHVR
jgi:hypothetical protein